MARKDKTPISTTVVAKLTPEYEAIIDVVGDRSMRKEGKYLTKTDIIKEALKAYAKEKEIPEIELKKQADKIYKTKVVQK